MRPEASEYAGFFERYVDLVPETDVLPVMAAQLDEMLAFLAGRTGRGAQACVHAPCTWTFKEARLGTSPTANASSATVRLAVRPAPTTTPLAGFDENTFAQAADYNRLAFADVVSEFEAARRSNLWLFRNMPAESCGVDARRGKASNNRVSVRALAYIIVGHSRHHMAILRKRLATV